MYLCLHLSVTDFWDLTSHPSEVMTRWKSQILCRLWCGWTGTCAFFPVCFVGKIWPSDSNLLIKELIVILWCISEAPETRTKQLAVPMLLLAAPIISDPCPGTATPVGNPTVSHSYRINTCHARVGAKRGVSGRRNLSCFHLACWGWMARNGSDFGCQPAQGAASLSSCSWTPHRTSTAVWRQGKRNKILAHFVLFGCSWPGEVRRIMCLLFSWLFPYCYLCCWTVCSPHFVEGRCKLWPKILPGAMESHHKGSQENLPWVPGLCATSGAPAVSSGAPVGSGWCWQIHVLSSLWLA